MANATSTNLLQGLAVANKKWQSAEHRPVSTSVLAAAYAAEKANPMLAELRTREDRPTSIDFIASMAEGAATARTALHTGASGDTIREAVDYQGFVETFSISMKQFDNNTIGFAEAYSSWLNTKVNNILKRADTWYLAQMVAALTAVNESGLGTFDAGVTNIFTVPVDQKDFYIQNVIQMMRDNDYNGPIGLIGDSKASVVARQTLFQGEGNSQNLGWQLKDEMVTFMQTSKEVLASTNQALLAFPFELIGIIPWIPKQNQKDVDVDASWNSAIGDFARITVPIKDGSGNVAYNVPIAISHYAARSNSSGRNGSAQDVLLEVEVSLDLAAAYAPLSTKRGAGDTVVYGCGLATS